MATHITQHICEIGNGIDVLPMCWRQHVFEGFLNMKTLIPSKQVATHRRDDGIERSADHAERTRQGWQDQAVEIVEWFCRVQGTEPFMAEEVDWFARSAGKVKGVYTDPPDKRAWGAVMQRARREGLIEACGYAPARSSNLSPKVLWRRRMEERDD